MPKTPIRILSGFVLLASTFAAFAATPDRNAYALTGGRVIVAPGRVIESGVVIVRGGVIESVGPAGTAIPSDAFVVDLSGKTIHAAFIDPYVTVDRLEGKPPKRPSDDETSSTPAPMACPVKPFVLVMTIRSASGPKTWRSAVISAAALPPRAGV